MMTVLNEVKNVKKYHFIHFVEFLDMICRIAILGITLKDTIAVKVHWLLDMVYDKMHELEELDEEEQKLLPLEKV